MTRHEPIQRGSFQIASVGAVGEAMTGWDTDSQAGLWVAPSPLDVKVDLPPLQLREPDAAVDEEW